MAYLYVSSKLSLLWPTCMYHLSFHVHNKQLLYALWGHVHVCPCGYTCLRIVPYNGKIWRALYLANEPFERN